MSNNIANSEPSGNLTNFIGKLLLILTFLSTLISFVVNVQKGIQDSKSGLLILTVFFICYAVVTIWFTFKAKQVRALWRWINLLGFYTVTAISCVLIGTWLPPQSTTPSSFYQLFTY